MNSENNLSKTCLISGLFNTIISLIGSQLSLCSSFYLLLEPLSAVPLILVHFNSVKMPWKFCKIYIFNFVWETDRKKPQPRKSILYWYILMLWHNMKYNFWKGNQNEILSVFEIKMIWRHSKHKAFYLLQWSFTKKKDKGDLVNN